MLSKTLILGGEGYIGSVLQEYLPDATIYDIKSGYDINNLDQLYPAIQKADKIIHLAGLSNDQVVNSSPSVAWQTNYLANVTISKLLKYTKKKLVFASSCSVYGDSDKSLVDETSTINPLLLYARGKALSEELFKDQVVLRFSTVK